MTDGGAPMSPEIARRVITLFRRVPAPGARVLPSDATGDGVAQTDGRGHHYKTARARWASPRTRLLPLDHRSTKSCRSTPRRRPSPRPCVAPRLRLPHNTAPADALVRLTPPDVRAVSVSTCDAFGSGVATSHPRSLRVCVAGGCHASRICSDRARIEWETESVRLFDCDLLCPAKLMPAKPRHEGHKTTYVLDGVPKGTDA